MFHAAQGHDGPIMAMAYHASGGLLATAGADKKACVWDMDGGFCTHFFRGHTGVVTAIMFHKDSKRLMVRATLKTKQVCAHLSWIFKSKFLSSLLV